MKKSLLTLLGAGLLLTSCQSDEPFAPVEGGEKQVTFTLNVPGELGTRAAAGANQSDKGGATNQGADQIYYTLVLDANGDTQILKASNTGTSATFTPTVVLGRNYTITAYASFDDNASIDDKEDIEAIEVSKNFNDESKDAYFKTLKHNFAEGDLQPLTLTRPFGKLRLVAEDYDPAKTKVETVTITYHNSQKGTFNATTEAFTIPNQGTEVTEVETKGFGYYEAADVAGAHTIFAEYLPAPKTGEYPVTFTVEVKYFGSDEKYSRTFNDIPVRRNALTTLSGNFFTANSKITVKVDENFDNTKAENIEFVSVSTASQLQDAIENVKDGETIKLFSDIKFDADNYYDNGGWKDGLGYTGDKSFTIDLNGYTIGQDGSLNDYLLWIKNVGSKANTITIKNGTLDAGTTAYCALCTASSHDNKLTINLENVTLINKISNGSTVKVRAGSVLNVNAGTEIIGKDSYLGIENWNAEVNVYDGAKIYMNGTSSYNGCLIGVGGNGTINVYGGYGKGVSGGLIAMTSGGTINVSGGEWIANTDGTYANSNKSVLIAQSDKQYNAGAGNAVVNVTGGTFKGGYNCYGNAVGDAQINISGGNFNADPANHVASGYKAIENGGKYYVVPNEFDAVATTTEELNNALGKGLSVVLEKDIDFGSTQLAIVGENQVVDLGGHTLTTANNWGGISLKNGACIKNGTITHAGNTAAIKAFNGTSVENVTINATCSTADKTVTGIAVQEGANVESIKNVTINGVSQGIEVGYKATVGLIENAVVNESNNGTAKGIGLVINGGMVGKAKNCTFKGKTYGITLHLKGVFAAGLELENCKVEGTTASIYAWDEKGVSNTSGSLTLTYDAATTLTGPFVWDFEDECQSVVTLNRPQ